MPGASPQDHCPQMHGHFLRNRIQKTEESCVDVLLGESLRTDLLCTIMSWPRDDINLTTARRRDEAQSIHLFTEILWGRSLTVMNRVDYCSMFLWQGKKAFHFELMFNNGSLIPTIPVDYCIVSTATLKVMSESIHIQVCVDKRVEIP